MSNNRCECRLSALALFRSSNIDEAPLLIQLPCVGMCLSLCPQRIRFERAVSYLLDRRCDDFTPARLAHSETQQKAFQSLALAEPASLLYRAGPAPVEIVKENATIKCNKICALVNSMSTRKRNNVKVFGSGDRTLVFAHGYGCDQSMWRHVTPSFPDYQIVLFDYVGSGYSDAEAFDRTRYRP